MLSKWSANAEQMGLYKIRKDNKRKDKIRIKTSIIKIKRFKQLKKTNLYEYTKKLFECLRTYLNSV
jgi:hypothetical protein